ncbi:MAG: hypothetical protein K8R21_13560, partial [Leptospira sp.]|nr:hypothetical protein [Leptospira sp.]
MLKQIYCIFLFTIISISVHSQEKIEVKFSGSSVSRPGKHEIETNRIGLYSPKGVKGQVFIPSGIDGTSPAALIVYFHGNSGGKLNAYQSE